MLIDLQLASGLPLVTCNLARGRNAAQPPAGVRIGRGEANTRLARTSIRGSAKPKRQIWLDVAGVLIYLLPGMGTGILIDAAIKETVTVTRSRRIGFIRCPCERIAQSCHSKADASWNFWTASVCQPDCLSLLLSDRRSTAGRAALFGAYACARS